MAFPSVVTPRGTSAALASATSHVVAMPASATTARGVLVIFTADSGPTFSITGTGWTLLGQAANAAFMGSCVIYKRPGVTLAALTVNLSFAEEGTYVVLAVDGAAPAESPYVASFAVTGANTDPPSLTPTGGARDYLWVAVRTGEAAVIATAAPTSYAGLTSATGGASGASTSTAERSLNAASENPGAFTSATEDCVAWTIAIPPSSSDQSVTMAAGIPSGERFGAGTVTTGAASVTTASIPTAEVFGAGQVNLAVTQAAGIPSAESVATTSTLIIQGAIGSEPIPSGERFGPSAVVVGPVAVTSGSIPSAESVPATSALALTVTSPSIPSPAAVPGGTVTVGAALVIGASIPSAESFGAGIVAPGPVAVASTAIPSGERFGEHRVSITIFSPSIPSAESVPGGLITVGAIAIVSPSIPSGERFGDGEITVTLDPTKRIRAVKLRLVPLYEVMVVGRVPAMSGPPTFLEVEPIDWAKLTWSSTLSKRQGLAVTCKTASITEPIAQRLRTPDRLPTELRVSRNGRRVFAGPLLGGGRNGDEITLECGGLLTYLEWMIVAADLRFDQVDQFGIAAALIDQWQALDFGHFGIDTSSVGTSGVLRDRSYVRDEIHQVGRRVEELGAVRDGFDAEIDPTTRKLQLWYPGKGVDRSIGDDAIVFDGRSIDDQTAMFSIAPGDLASDAFGTGSKSGGEAVLWSTQFNADLRAAFGRSAVTGSYDVELQGTLDDYVGGLLDARDQPLRAPGRKVRVPVDADLDSYDVGDRITYELDDLLGIGGTFRIRSRTVDVDRTGAESVDLEFV